MMYEHASAGILVKWWCLTCGLRSEFVPVGGTHSQQPVAQVQVKALLSGDATHHLEEEAMDREYSCCFSAASKCIYLSIYIAFLMQYCKILISNMNNEC